MTLSANQIEQYRTEGVVIADRVLDPKDLTAVIDDINCLIDGRARQLKRDGKIRDLNETAGFSQRLALLCEQTPDANEGMDIMHARRRAMFEFLFNTNLLDAVECLVGGEITCNPIQHLRPKLPQSNTSQGNVPWHQDAAVTWEEADPVDIITCWIPLVDATEENGCMRVLPTVAQRGYLQHESDGGTTIKAQDFPREIEPLVATCAVGDVIFMNKYTPHSGLPNRTQHIRWSLDLRYQPSGAATGRPFWPAVVVRSRRDPTTEQRSYEQWCARWEEALVKSRGYHWHRILPPEQRVPTSR